MLYFIFVKQIKELLRLFSYNGFSYNGGMSNLDEGLLHVGVRLETVIGCNACGP
jgi:hypothetical protein